MTRHYTGAEAVAATKKGTLIIICDHPERENEGDFFIAAEKIGVPELNTMIQLGRGLVCCPLSPKSAQRLELTRQSARNTSLHNTQFTVSIDSRYCKGSGISAIDRVQTITSLADPRSTANDFVRPGHIFPIVSHENGLGSRSGHTEAAIALLELAGLAPVGVICEIINDEGAMSSLAELETLALSLNIGIINVEQIKKYYMEKKGEKK